MRRRVISTLVTIAFAAGLLAPVARAGSFSGTVTDATTGDPVPGVQIGVWRQNAPDEWTGSGDMTDAAGHYSVSGLPEADYLLEFAPYGQNYVYEYYENKRDNLDGDPVHLNEGEDRTVDVSLAVGGRITGRVVSSVGDEPLEGVEVCAYSQTDFTGECGKSDAEGDYAIQGLRTDSYVVSFFPYWNLPYFQRWYGGVTDSDDATWVPVTEGSTTGGIDEALLESAGVAGTLTDAETGEPLGEVEVCTIEVGVGEFPRCTMSHEDGTYVVGGMDSGEYKLVFSPEHEELEGIWGRYDNYFVQYYDRSSSLADAQSFSLVNPGLKSGIDARLTPIQPRLTDGGSPFAVPYPTSAADGPPVTYLLRKESRVHGRSATFRFSSASVDMRFQCRLDRRPFRPCHSPRTYRHLAYGWHGFAVRAQNALGMVDPTPARFGRFLIRRP